MISKVSEKHFKNRKRGPKRNETVDHIFCKTYHTLVSLQGKLSKEKYRSYIYTHYIAPFSPYSSSFPPFLFPLFFSLSLLPRPFDN